MKSTKAQHLIEQLDSIDEIGRVGGNILRNTIAYNPIGGHIIRAPLKGIARRGGVGDIVAQHKMDKDRIKYSDQPHKTAAINNLERETLTKIAGHVAKQQGYRPEQGISSSNIRRAKRALYGTVLGSRVL